MSPISPSSMLAALTLAIAVGPAAAQQPPTGSTVTVQPTLGDPVTITITPPVNAPITVQPAPTAPITVQPYPGPSAGVGSGTRQCVTTLSGCGFTKADWVGKHTVDTTCDVGFYDLIWGGTCWQAPVDDGKGTWVRSAVAVDRDDAFWRVPKESTAAATKVKKTAWAWECPSGSFWDGHDWGGCWTCPATHPRRTAAAVWAGNACATSLNETKKARFVGYNGCPKPEPTAMGLKGKRMPGRPFLDVAGGGCYACPTADEDGSILVTERNGSPVYGDNKGCTIKYKWKPNPYPEPGLAALGGVREILAENGVFDDPNVLTAFLTAVAVERGLTIGTPAADRFVAGQWQEIARDPSKNAQVAALVYKYLEAAAAKEPATRTAAEQRLVQSFEGYVQKRRTFIAEQALAMYLDWKAFIDAGGDRTKSQLETMFDYGTVPWDFQSAAAAGLGLGAIGAGAVGTAVAMQAHFIPTAKAIKDATDAGIRAGKTGSELYLYVDGATRNQTFFSATSGLRGFQALATGSKLGLIAGPAIIQAAFAVIGSIALDQFIEIQEARSKLEATIAEAKEPVDLKALLAEPTGRDQLAFFWAKAIEGPSGGDPALQAKAAAVQQLAARRGYQLAGI